MHDGKKPCLIKKIPLMFQNQNMNVQGTHNVLLVGIGANNINVKTMQLLKKHQKYQEKFKSVTLSKSRSSCRYLLLI